MRSSIKKSKIMNIVCIIVVFCLLSYVKFYTAQISFINDPTISIVKTKNIQWISNTHKIDKEDVHIIGMTTMDIRFYMQMK